MSLEEGRRLRCASCGYVIDRDVNAARNILARGLEMSISTRFKPVCPAVEAVKGNPMAVIPGADAGKVTPPQVARTQPRTLPETSASPSDARSAPSLWPLPHDRRSRLSRVRNGRPEGLGTSRRLCPGPLRRGRGPSSMAGCLCRGARSRGLCARGHWT